MKQKRGMYHSVVEDVALSILSGKVLPGDKLAAEQDLVQKYGVSRTVVRDALRILTAKGFLEARPRAGTIVRPVSDWNFLDREVVEWAVGEHGKADFFDDFMTAREAMEPQIVGVAAQQATLRDVQNIEGAYKRMAESHAAGDIEGYLVADLDFHMAILKATNNLVLQQFGGLFQAALRASFVKSIESGMCSKESLLAHEEVLEGIRNRDVIRAQRGLKVILSDPSARAVKQRRRSMA